MPRRDDDLPARLEAALASLLLRRNRTALHARMLARANDERIDETLYPVLSGLARTGPATAAALGADIGLDRSVVSRHADRLEQLGLLARAPHPADRRATLLDLTPSGHEAVAGLRTALTATLADQLADWPADDARAFVAGLERFVGEIA